MCRDISFLHQTDCILFISCDNFLYHISAAEVSHEYLSSYDQVKAQERFSPFRLTFPGGNRP